MNLRIKSSTLVFILSILLQFTLFAQENPKSSPQTESVIHEKPSEVPQKITIKPTVKDEEISKRLESILQATNWFIEPHVEVQDGVVFLSGQTKNHQFKNWAGDLAHNTENVAAVVNKIVVLEPSI